MKTRLFCALMSSVIALPTSALAAPVRVDIPAQPLASALQTLGQRTGLQIVFKPGLVGDYRSAAVAGVIEPVDALRALLAGSNLTFAPSGRGYVILPVPRVQTAALTTAALSAQQPVSDAAPSSAQEAAPPPAPAEDIIVTGSRVITNGNNMPTPVTVVTLNDMQSVRPTTVFEGLLDLPQFAGSRGATTNPGAAGATNNNTSGLNFRGLTQQRGLVLYDSHRVSPTQADGIVNINMIPQLLLSRVEVVTGGVSAVYGSDAITGVVNFITDRKFNGIKGRAQYGISEFNDDPAYEVGIAAGTDLFGSRGHFEASYERHDDRGILLRTARQFGRERWTLQGAGTEALPYFLVPFARISTVTFGGKILGPATNPLANQMFVAPGVLAPFTNGSTTGVIGSIQLGGDGGYHTSTSLKARLNFDQVFGRFDFDLTPDIHFYTSFAGSRESNFTYNQDFQLNNVTLSTTNAFLPAVYQQRMAALQTFTFGKIFTLDSIGPQTGDNTTKQWMVNTGLEGKLGAFRWDLAYVHGDARQINRQRNAVDNVRMSAALDAVRDSTGQIVCRVTITNPGLFPGCVPINVFGEGSESQAAIDYVVQGATFRPTVISDDVSGTIAGSPFSTWAGPLELAFSSEWRKIGYKLTSDSLPNAFDPINCTTLGLRFNCITFNPVSGAGTTRLSTSVSNRPPVSQEVAEGAVEADVPLIKDWPLIQSFNVNAAYRYAKYTIKGNPIITLPNETRKFSAETWKVGLDWNVVNTLRVRATRSRDFRAPSLADLFAPGQITTSALPDLLTGLTPNALSQTGGNPDLVPEIGNTVTLGMVWRPSPRFSLSVDGYDIKITNAIVNANGAATVSQNACYDSGGTSFYCTLQERPGGFTRTAADMAPANVVTKYYQRQVNIAKIHTYGIDTEANFKSRVFDRPFSLRALVGYQPHIKNFLPGAPVQDFAGVAFNNSNQAGAVWRVSVFGRIDLTDRLTVDALTRWRSALHTSADPTAVIGRGDPDRIAPVSYTNLNLSYKIRGFFGEGSIYFNIQNLFDRAPDAAANSGPQAAPGNFGGYAPGDDPIGRYYSAGFRFKL